MNINVNETMDFLIGYIVDKLNEIKDNKNEKNIDNNKKQIILSNQNEEKVKNAMKKLSESNCCENIKNLDLENKINSNEKISNNSYSTNVNSEEEKKENE